MKNDGRLPDEKRFRDWHKGIAKQTNTSSNPYDSRHHYDYKAAYRANAKPDSTGHMTSTYKKDSHPNLVVRADSGYGWTNSKTGKHVRKR